MPLTSEHITTNEILSRRVNEAIEEGRRDREGLVPFVCECGVLGCNDVVEVTLNEYEAVRAGSRCFLVVPGHGADFDVVRLVTERYAIVRKPEGPLGDHAERTDPRREVD